MNGPHIIELGVYGSLDINTSHIVQKWVAIHTYKLVSWEWISLAKESTFSISLNSILKVQT